MNVRFSHRRLTGLSLLALAVALVPSVHADDYTIDGVHSSVSFKASHIGISEVHGRFNDFSGSFKLDDLNSSFSLTIKAESVDTNNKKRDDHLRSPDFFNAKQFPSIVFKSTKVVPGKKDPFEVTGDLTMHGKTQQITFTLAGGKKAEFPKGSERVGFSTTLKLKRSDFGMDKMVGPIGDDVEVSIAFEGVKK